MNDNYQPAGQDYEPECPYHAGDPVLYTGLSVVHRALDAAHTLLRLPPTGTKGAVIIPPVDGVSRCTHGDNLFYVWVDFEMHGERLMISDQLEVDSAPSRNALKNSSETSQKEPGRDR